jgi:hypothetical protein
MLKKIRPAHLGIILMNYLILFIKELVNILHKFLSINFYTDDMIYKKKFIKKFMPYLYERHISDLHSNCVYCANLVRSNCHKHCLKCSTGTYVHCSPLLPGILYYENKHPYNMNNESIPWLYKNTCTYFKRLDANNYFKNFKVPFSWVTIYNYEILDGLMNGIFCDEKPCHICATIDYQLYKNCFTQKGFDKKTPCTRIAAEIASRYNNVPNTGIS